jgi:DNA-binding transcriptional LysR family regulator
VAQVARDGVGIALLPSWLIKNDLEDGALRPLLDAYQCDFNRSAGDTYVFATFPSWKGLGNTAKAFIDFLEAELA